MNKLYVGSSTEKKIKRGVQLLDDKDCYQAKGDDQLVGLYNQSHHFLGTAYLSRQNKGRGWFLSPKKVTLTEAYFFNLFRIAKERRQPFENSDFTTSYRLFNQDGDNFGGITVDRYADFAVFSWYNPFVYQHRDTIVKAFQQAYPEIKGGYEKIRFKGLNYESAHLYGQEAPSHFTILENGVKYSVFMNDGLMTGIFLDQHDVRNALINELGLGKRVLNMFSYTAAFSVAAAMGGAVETTSVDLAKRSRELSKAHFESNGLDLAAHHFVVMDVFEYFKYAKRKHLTFDVIVIDPPSFARNKKHTFSVAKDYHRLISQALDILADDGIIIASTNASNVSVAQFKKQLEKGFASVKHDYLRLQQLPSDFTVNEADAVSNYLKVFTIRVKK
ncbi:class I SAM-dependent rRNA methyltransferase [Streptococcus alactolyticus]|uniref:class I SAM-dependent rRNA methyltransferase n=1 Tax=Streptococcus alactolyticus TaxID=29389 RepID=UPI003F98E7E2